MTIKTVEMVRKIRDQNYEKTKNLTVEEQIKFIKSKSKELIKNTKYSKFLGVKIKGLV